MDLPIFHSESRKSRADERWRYRLTAPHASRTRRATSYRQHIPSVACGCAQRVHHAPAGRPLRADATFRLRLTLIVRFVTVHTRQQKGKCARNCYLVPVTALLMLLVLADAPTALRWGTVGEVGEQRATSRCTTSIRGGGGGTILRGI
jgi:hypothetical protein